jgi:hypothetical protein
MDSMKRFVTNQLMRMLLMSQFIKQFKTINHKIAIDFNLLSVQKVEQIIILIVMFIDNLINLFSIHLCII